MDDFVACHFNTRESDGGGSSEASAAAAAEEARQRGRAAQGAGASGGDVAAYSISLQRAHGRQPAGRRRREVPRPRLRRRPQLRVPAGAAVLRRCRLPRPAGVLQGPPPARTLARLLASPPRRRREIPCLMLINQLNCGFVHVNY
uniref:Uncharacterized protein n=1 Tax=Oryza sativa subsp. japonica TaxID=39947 RepID=Q6ZB16_ORYSJ|nr:hypothetical protein [Oryza sativa Japonica Group]